MLGIGIDVGGTSVRAGVVDERGVVLETAQCATPTEESALDEAIVGMVQELARRYELVAVGLAVAAFVRPDRRSVMFAPHLPWRDVAVTDRISTLTGLPVTLEHDANAAAVAEYHFGAAQRAQVATLVALGTGVGGALLLDGVIFRGAHGVAPELGHLCVVPGGRACPCGKSGCWERYCSGTALAATATELLVRFPDRSTILARQAVEDPGSLTGWVVAHAARQGDYVARLAVAELARWLGEGLALIADVYDPEIVVIAGGVSKSATLFLNRAHEHYIEKVTGADRRPLVDIRTATLGGDAAIVGAATLAKQQRTFPS